MSNDQESLEKIQESAENGDLEQAFAQCEKIIEQNPGDGEALHLSAYILILQGLPDRAIDRLLQVIGEHPGSADYHATLAIAYQSDGNKKEACASYRRLLNLVPDDLGALISLAEMNAVNGIDAKNVDIQEGVSVRMMGFFVARSFTYFERALAVDSSDPGVTEFGQALVRHLQQNMTSKMDAAVPDGIGRGKPKVIYPLRVIGRIGHLIIEPFLLKCLFDPEQYDIIVLTVPVE
ncbi:MAG TPA: tetratricopeptide repeat protein, partial [Rhodospirillales bacterium]|nr:tetratricopeptide repeat protein [Rhodospirillales bacterium]